MGEIEEFSWDGGDLFHGGLSIIKGESILPKANLANITVFLKRRRGKKVVGVGVLWSENEGIILRMSCGEE